MALAALVLAASFATICYADYRADIDDVHNRLMAATSRSLHEPQLIPDAEPFHRGEDPREERTPPTVAVRKMTPRPQPATLAKTGRKANTGAGESAEGGSAPTPRTSAPARVIPASRRPASAARAPRGIAARGGLQPDRGYAETDDQGSFENGSAPGDTSHPGGRPRSAPASDPCRPASRPGHRGGIAARGGLPDPLCS